MKGLSPLLSRNYICLLCANFLLYFGFWMLTPILPFYLKEAFRQSENEIGIILSLYTISALMSRPFMGYLYDGFPRKPIYMCAYVVFTAIFLGYACAGTLLFFILLRVLHGISFGTVTVGGNTLVIDITPSGMRGQALGYYGLTNNIAMSLGPMTGLFLHQSSLGFKGIFIVALISCIMGLSCATVVRTQPKPTSKQPPLSLDRFILLKGIPAGIALLLLSIPYGATTNYVAMYAHEINMHCPTGFFFTLMAIGMGISRLFAGRSVDRGYITQTVSYGFYLIIPAFASLGALKWMMQYNDTIAIVAFYSAALALGIGFGTMFPAYNTLYVNLAPNNQRATATSTYLTSWDVGIGLGIYTGGLIAQSVDFSMVYCVGCVLCLLSMLYFNGYVTPHFHRNKVR